MNKTDQKAYCWLKNEGYKSIIFQRQDSPDFLTAEGIGFEVKISRNGIVLFTDKQWARLKSHPSTKIIIFDKGDTPIDVFNILDIPEPPSYFKQYHILLNRQYERRKQHKIETDNLTKKILAKLPIFYSVQQASQKIRVHENTILRWLNNGTLKGIRFGKLWRIPDTEIERKEKQDVATNRG